jgi:zinc transport system substrate-binding protein
MPSSLARVLAILFFLLAMALGPGCSKPPAPPAAPRSITVLVSIPPLAGLVKPLLTQGGEVRTLIPPGRSEHGIELKAAEISAIGQADVIVYVGLGLEPDLERFLSTHPDSRRRIVRFASLIHDEADHADHGQPDDGHHHGGTDPHLWLDPHLCEPLIAEAKSAIQTVYRERNDLSPAALRENEHAAQSLIGQLTALDEYAKSKLAPFKGQALVTHHAAWQRLADRYGLEIAAVIRPIETGEPTARAIADAIDAIRKRQVRAVFVEPQFDRAAADRIAQATGVKVVTIDPLGDGDYFATMRRNIDAIADALAPAPPPP